MSSISHRDISIDYLRFLGISMIILAHSSAPFSLTQIRCFDVPFMIFISGLTSSRKVLPPYIKYISRRSSRLLCPVYIFLTIYFILYYLLHGGEVNPMQLNLKKVVHSFLLLEGIGYVWIIRVFLLIMIITPFLVWFEKICKNDIIYGFICFSLLFTNDVLVRLQYPLPGGKYINIFFTDYLMYLIGYMPLFMLGIRMRFSTDRTKTIYMFSSIMILTIVLGLFVKTNGFPIEFSPRFKYPPQAIFLIYGATISLILYLFKEIISKVVLTIKISNLATFIGKNTIWIYLWHIPFVTLTNHFEGGWFIRYIIIYISALCVFGVQYNCVQKINNKFLNKYLIG